LSFHEATARVEAVAGSEEQEVGIKPSPRTSTLRASTLAIEIYTLKKRFQFAELLCTLRKNLSNIVLWRE
jgi:hypothetical protein